MMDPESTTPSSTPRYRGQLTIKEIAAGVEVAYETALGALEDGDLLHEAGRSGRAALSYLDCIQEIGRLHGLRAMARTYPNDQKAWRQHWWRLNRHDYRIAYALADLARAGQTFDNFRGLLDEFARIVNMDAPSLERLRKRLGYVAFDGGSRIWTGPESPSQEMMADLHTAAASLVERATLFRSLGLFTESALTLERESFSAVIRRLSGDPVALERLPDDPEVITSMEQFWAQMASGASDSGVR